MKYDKGINRYLLIVTALAVVLFCSFPLVSDAQKPAPQKKAGDPAADKASLPMEVSALEFRSEEQEMDFPAEKAKEIELLLTEKPAKGKPN